MIPAAVVVSNHKRSAGRSTGMKMNWVSREVTDMEPEEVHLFILYRQQLVEPNGRTRDDLPYTPQMETLLTRFNQRVNGRYSQTELWAKLRTVLKCGEWNIERFLESRGIPFRRKTKQ
jgi:hypothetical protein